jgi:glycosyltransferase involved in cell wall biosynthesis
MTENKIKILQVAGKMNRGGTETWLMHVLRNIDRDRFHFDFLVNTEEKCHYDDEIRQYGCNIISCPKFRNPFAYSYHFFQAVNKYGPYHIIHSNGNYMSGFILFLAKLAQIPVRISHCHNDLSKEQKFQGTSKHLFNSMMIKLVNRYATLGLAASVLAATSIYGKDWKSDSRWNILYCSISLNPFYNEVENKTLRMDLGLNDNSFVIGHVGSFTIQKNHAFMLKILQEALKMKPKTKLLLVGDGPLKQEILKKAVDMGISNSIIFAGVRDDVPRIMSGAMDVFLLPSFYEGLPVVGMEAQAAGLPFILSDIITDEVDIVKPLIKRLSLSQSPRVWAEECLKAGNIKFPQKDALALMEKSPFNIQTAVKKLEQLYLSQLAN